MPSQHEWKSLGTFAKVVPTTDGTDMFPSYVLCLGNRIATEN